MPAKEMGVLTCTVCGGALVECSNANGMIPPTPLYCCSVCERRYERQPDGRPGAEFRGSRPSEWHFYGATRGTPAFEQERRHMQREQLWIELRAALAQDLTEDEAAGLAVEVVEPLVDMYWADVAPEFETLAIRTPLLRRAIAGCMFSNPEAADRLYRLVRSEDEAD